METQQQAPVKKYYYYKKVEHPQKPGVKKVVFPEELRAKVLEMRKTEKSIRQISIKAGISQYHVRQILAN